MKSKLNFLILFLVVGIIFAGCSKEDCSLKDTTYQKYSYDDAQKQCVVSKTIQKDVCGNGVIEGDENFCTCPKDVIATHPTKGCSGTLGVYLEKGCSDEKMCVLKQNAKVVEQTKNVEFKSTDLTFDASFKLNMPYVQNSFDENKVEVELKLFKVLSSTTVVIKNIVVKELTVENSNSISLANAVYEDGVDMTNNILPTKILTFSDSDKYEKKEPIKLKLVVSYSKEYYDSKGAFIRSEPKIETLTSSLGTWTIINSNLYVDEKKK